MKTWAKGVYMGQEFAVNNIVRFMAVHGILRSMTIRVPDHIIESLVEIDKACK